VNDKRTGILNQIRDRGLPLLSVTRTRRCTPPGDPNVVKRKEVCHATDPDED
jgi:hypothetical protein